MYVMGLQDTKRTCQKKVMNVIEEILIYYFHIVVSKVRFTGSVGRSSYKYRNRTQDTKYKPGKRRHLR